VILALRVRAARSTGTTPDMPKEATMLDGEFEHDGKTFCARTVNDECMGAPWDEDGGHGPVSGWVKAGYNGYVSKRPGQRVLCSDRSAARLYDYEAACAIARRDGWSANIADYEACERGEISRRQRAARAVDADMERLRKWCDGTWGWMILEVAPVCACCGEAKWDKRETLGGMESDCDEHIAVTCAELAAEISARAA
jgi:hypothetical protein